MEEKCTLNATLLHESTERRWEKKMRCRITEKLAPGECNLAQIEHNNTLSVPVVAHCPAANVNSILAVWGKSTHGQTHELCVAKLNYLYV